MDIYRVTTHKYSPLFNIPSHPKVDLHHFYELVRKSTIYLWTDLPYGITAVRTAQGDIFSAGKEGKYW